MNVLVLGSTGQIGQALLKALSSTGHNVTTLVRSAADQAFPGNVTVLERKSFTHEVFRDALAGVDHVIYGIGLPEQFLFDNSVFDTVNCGVLQRFLEAFGASGIDRLTYLSTYEVFKTVGNDIVETHDIADPTTMTPYFQSMIRAYRMVEDFAKGRRVQLTTIHPAAVYGGANTGSGVTDYMENLVSRNWTRVPFISPSSFPVVHVESLAAAIVGSLDKPGSYIVSDQMTSLEDIAHAMHEQTRSYLPPLLPLWATMIGVRVLESFARVTRTKPLASAVQIAFLTKGWRPLSHKAKRDLGWSPMSLEEGIGRFLAARQR